MRLNVVPPVGWADVATKHDLDALGLQIRAEFSAQLHKELRQQLVTFLTANTILLGVFTAVGQLLG